MNLLPQSVRNQLPPLYGTEKERDPMVRVKFFMTGSRWSWYGIEFDGHDLFYGYVAGDFSELGYFQLADLKRLRNPLGLGVERDLYFHPCRLSEVKATIQMSR